jgi:hypothetical protein
MTRFVWVGLFGMIVLNSATADDKPQTDDEKAALAAIIKAGAPGEAHQKLEPMIGEWDLAVKTWMGPGRDPTETKGTASHHWILGKRYLHQDVKGEFAGQKFEGAALLGYDNLKKKYFSAWIDNMSTALSVAEGDVDASGKVFTFFHDDINPVSQQKMRTKDVVTILDEDRMKLESFKLGGGHEIKTMEISYTRKK